MRYARLLALLCFTAALLFAISRSLLLSSAPIEPGERRVVTEAIGVLEERGFTREVFALRYLANYRSTDNWWNASVGHQQAYAATNFPFEVVTLYPAFFGGAVDDVERAAILLHEAQHLMGAGEDAALEAVWREKSRLPWTGERYASSLVWRNTREWTALAVPALFRCGPTGQGDCVP